MPDLLLELRSEEIPARMQSSAAEGIRKALVAELDDGDLKYKKSTSFVTPRRVCVVVEGLRDASAGKLIERRGPREGADEKALAGFLRANGVTRDNLVLREEGKGKYYFAKIRVPARQARPIVAEAVKWLIAKYSWPKSMVSGDGGPRWVRPLRGILCVLYSGTGTETVEFEFAGIRSGDSTRGHPFMAYFPKPNHAVPNPACDSTRGRPFTASEAFKVTSFDDYSAKLERAYVILDPLARRERIRCGAESLAKEKGLVLVKDSELLDEIVGLTEWPVAMIGPIGERFLRLPPELVQAAMKLHQKYLSAVDPDTRAVTHFIAIADKETKDGGRAMLAGNHRVLNSRLEDAEFHWESDIREADASGMDGFSEQLGTVNFHRRLGTMAQRVARTEALAHEVSAAVGADAEMARSGASLAKADLVTSTVREFPELQGRVGRWLSERCGFRPEVAEACELHYLPNGPSDPVPTEPVAIAVGLADRIDYLAGFFGIGEAPTGSKDPHALRRAALGIVRILLESRTHERPIRLRLRGLFEQAVRQYAASEGAQCPDGGRTLRAVADSVIDFLHERLSVHLREAGVRRDLIRACASAQHADDLVLLVDRVQALGAVFETQDGQDLLNGYRRVNNILAAEKGKEELEADAEPNKALMTESAETDLLGALEVSEGNIAAALEKEDFRAAAHAMASLRPHIDRFFDEVRVNVPDAALRTNRLKLLRRVRDVCDRIADLAAVEH